MITRWLAKFANDSLTRKLERTEKFLQVSTDRWNEETKESSRLSDEVRDLSQALVDAGIREDEILARIDTKDGEIDLLSDEIRTLALQVTSLEGENGILADQMKSLKTWLDCDLARKEKDLAIHERARHLALSQFNKPEKTDDGQLL